MPNSRKHSPAKAVRNRTAKTYWLPMPRREADIIVLQYRIALETIRSNRATQVEAQCVAHAVLLTNKLTGLGYGRLDAAFLEGVEEDTVAMLERGSASGEYWFREEGVAHLIDVINEHDRQLREVHLAALVACNERLKDVIHAMANAPEQQAH
jgi:hypothetical protein